MKESTDEILQRIAARLDARKSADISLSKTAPESVHNTAIRLNVDQITSSVYVIAPTQIDYIAEIFGNRVADAMNMRAFAPKIREIAGGALRDALRSAKSQGLKK